jgi:hypothetical protein
MKDESPKFSEEIEPGNELIIVITLHNYRKVFQCDSYTLIIMI